MKIHFAVLTIEESHGKTICVELDGVYGTKTSAMKRVAQLVEGGSMVEVREVYIPNE